MIEINSKKIEMWSKIGSRATFGLSVLDIEKKIKNLCVLTCDVSTSAGLDRFRKQVPEKFLELGISEQNLIGMASGLSSEGFEVITTTFAPFQTMRCCEQIKVNLGYMNTKVIMAGLASGLVLGSLGYTHCSVEDVGVLRSIPNITIISPADGLEVVKTLVASLNYDKSVYIRLTGGANITPVYVKDYKFEIGKAVKLKEGNDITIIACGAAVGQSLKAAEILKDKNIDAAVVNMHTIKPIDKDIIIEEANSKKIIVTVEEHNIIGGLGSAVAEVLSSVNSSSKLLTIGINDKYSKSGSYEFLLKYYGLTADKIVETITKNFIK
jgi:transketolase